MAFVLLGFQTVKNIFTGTFINMKIIKQATFYTAAFSTLRFKIELCIVAGS